MPLEAVLLVKHNGASVKVTRKISIFLDISLGFIDIDTLICDFNDL